MTTEILSLVLGLVLLVVAGDLLVRGAVNAAVRLGIPALLVSLTIVAFGTSAPELLVSISALRAGTPDIALGNVIGSNIANILLVLGIPALISGLDTGQSSSQKSYLIMLAVSAVFIALCMTQPLGIWQGAVLTTLLVLFLLDQAREGLAQREAAEIEGVNPGLRWWRILLYLVLGLCGLPLGAQILVDSASTIARTIGISEAVIGLTIVAIGTSLPELATTVVAAFRRHTDVALGNVIGSNIFNILAIIGVPSLFFTIPVAPMFLQVDLWVMIAASLAILPFALSRGRNMTKRWGILLVAGYVVYVISAVWMGRV